MTLKKCGAICFTDQCLARLKQGFSLFPPRKLLIWAVNRSIAQSHYCFPNDVKSKLSRKFHGEMTLFASAFAKGGEIRDTKTLNLARNIVSLQVWVDVSRFSPCMINLSRNKNICCGLKKVVAKIRACLFLFDKPIECFAFLFTLCFYVYFSISYESRSNLW